MVLHPHVSHLVACPQPVVCCVHSLNSLAALGHSPQPPKDARKPGIGLVALCDFANTLALLPSYPAGVTPQSWPAWLTLLIASTAHGRHRIAADTCTEGKSNPDTTAGSEQWDTVLKVQALINGDIHCRGLQDLFVIKSSVSRAEDIADFLNTEK